MQPPATKADYERMWAGCRAHNRWLVDFCAATPGRRAGIALILLNDPEQAVREIRWARAAGLTGGVLLPGIAPGAAIAPLHSADYEPVWAVCEELSMPLNHHPDSAAPPIVLEPRSLAMHIIEVKWFMHRALWHLIFSGAFQRHPGLNLVLAEQGADWIPGVLYTLDYYWERFQLRAAQEARFGGGGVDELPLRPSEYWARNCYTGATFMRPAEVAQREKIGVSQIMWGQDYPHPEATFPWSREALRHTFSDVDPAEVLAMVSTNACRVFGFDATTLGQVADEIGAPTVEEVRTPLDKIPDGATCPAFADADSARAW
jgi:predicted TIM-barrel fold metal-dependent hydrolase